MKYNKYTRRMFLSGAKDTILAIPFLPSLLPREAWAAAACTTPPTRFFMMNTEWSPAPEWYIGSLAGNQRISATTNVRSLAGLSNISPFFGSDFNGLLNKISIIRGLDHYSGGHDGHNAVSGSCAAPIWWSSTDEKVVKAAVGGNDHNLGPRVNMSSIDVVLAYSKQMYPGAIADNRRLISLCPYSTKSDSAKPSSPIDHGWSNNGSWKKGVSVASKDAVITYATTQNLYERFVADFTNGTMGTTPPPTTTLAKKDVVQAVFEDFKAVRSNANISADDRTNLDQFMAHIADMITSLGSTSTGVTTGLNCKKPVANLADNGTEFGRFRNQVDLVIAAMACDITRVGSVANHFLNTSLDQHTLHHTLGGANVDGFSITTEKMNLMRDQWAGIGKRVAYVLNKMNSIVETGGTLLDHSIVYHWTEHGMVTRDKGTFHNSVDHAVMVAGGGSGALQTGYYIDYLHQTEKRTNKGGWPWPAGNSGLAINNLLTTFCNVFKVPTTEYERAGKQGFGCYENEANGGYLHGLDGYTDAHRAFVLGMRRSSLPFLFKKSIC